VVNNDTKGDSILGATAVFNFLHFIGEDPRRPGLKETPQRVVKAWQEMFSGYDVLNPQDLLKTFEDDGLAKYDEMIVVRGIEFQSHCEHHILPFSGVVTVGYLPKDKVVGLSKIPRLVDAYAKRLQVQERLTVEIADALNGSALAPKGVGVIIEATHSCMSCRGVKKQNASMVTSALRGAFKTDSTTRAEFLNLGRK
jgi:GTP cyclohydrolase I